jgi:hypothetical protein
MDFGLEFFFWPRPVDPANGYAWESGKAAPFFAKEPGLADAAETRFLRWLTSAPQVHRVNIIRTYPTLYRTFANLAPTEEAFLAFANEFGALGVDVLLEDAYKTSTTKEGKKVKTLSLGNPRNTGEPFWRWLQEQSKMRGITKVLTAIESSDTSALAQWFTITDSDVVFKDENRWAIVCSSQHQLRPLIWGWVVNAPTSGEQLLRAARAWAQDEINEAMSGGGKPVQSLTSVRILLNTDRDVMRLHLVPDTLLAAMWLQCARVLTENVTFSDCQHCGKWFEVSPDQRRRNTKYCTDRCKVAAYRKRLGSRDKTSQRGSRHGVQKRARRNGKGKAI